MRETLKHMFVLHKQLSISKNAYKDIPFDKACAKGPCDLAQHKHCSQSNPNG